MNETLNSVEEFMEVPNHLYLAGRRGQRTQSISSAQDMFVPDKIVVGEGGRLIPHPKEPLEVVRDKLVMIDGTERVSPMPAHLTANEYIPEPKKAKKRVHPVLFESQESLNAAESITNLNNSLAVDLDPLRELKNVRRHLGRLATRVLELEDENQRRAIREYGLWTFVTGGFIILAFLIGKK
ncbi:unnamed protein product [Bursaphelenchus xylophilus]|uniref:Mitochondrial fission factor n=1 Tax=Bursaphelenchus xylophilus TaxID=6326 RepID=A0A1I7SMF2_BURXY|nr:unnamed protein product [Bursaphelenchus xylophilus]CAG9130166.1 unnamed protein product [Bursaphelenchus xylophilus]